MVKSSHKSTPLNHERFIYPVRNNALLLPPDQRPSGPAAAAGLDSRIIPAGFNAPLEFLTGFTPPKWENPQTLCFCNPSEAVKKLGESVERRYLQSFRIAAFDRYRSQGSASERE